MKKYTIGLYEKAMPENLTWEEKLSSAGRAGYDYVEMSLDATEEKINRIFMTEDERLRLVESMYRTGIPVRSFCVSALTKYALGDDDPVKSTRGMQILEGALQLAEDLGARIVMIPGYDIYYGVSTPKTQQRFIANLGKGAEMAASCGVQIGLETMENSFMDTVWKAMYYIRMIGSNYLGVYPDTGNVKNACAEQGCDESQDMVSGRGHVFALHLKESKPGIYREVPYGEGHVDFRKFVEAAWEIGVRKYVTEFWYRGSGIWETELKTACSGMRAILDAQTITGDTDESREKSDRQPGKVLFCRAASLSGERTFSGRS